MAIWEAIILGLVQGLTEFLPVSSSGHLLMFQELFGLRDVPLLFDIILHVATLCAVIIVLRKRIWQLIRKPFQKTNYCLVIATAISCALVLIFNQFFDLTKEYRILPVTFLVTAIILFVVTLIPKREGDVKYKTGVIAGIAQGIAAVIPGISRSGSTITANLATGVKREEAAEFAFLMSIPVIIASLVYEIISSHGDLTSMSFWPVAFGFVSALITGIFAIKIMLKIVKKIKLYWFSVYLVALSIVLMFVFYL